ncbi:MAG: AIPR family protein [Magnetococcales bacterium]|nr:AIPR family protein [Magnetococcales bacterium]
MDQVRRITYATNSQNSVDLSDLRANDERQRRLQTDIEQLGYRYQPKRMEKALQPNDISSGVAAEAILAVWRESPHQAKFFAREHFGKLYDHVFTDDLTGAQAIIAVLIYRMTENRRKRPQNHDPVFVRYVSCFMAMRMGVHLLKDLKIAKGSLDHIRFPTAKQTLDAKGESCFQTALQEIERALGQLYGAGKEISWQQRAATFCRGDLIPYLKDIE